MKPKTGDRSTLTLRKEPEWPELEIPAGFGGPLELKLPGRDKENEQTGEKNEDHTRKEDDRSGADMRLERTGTVIRHPTPRSDNPQCAKSATPPKTPTPRGKLPISESDLCGDQNLGSNLTRQRTNDSCVSVTVSSDLGGRNWTVRSKQVGDAGGMDSETKSTNGNLRGSTSEFTRELAERERKGMEEWVGLLKGFNGAEGEEKEGEMKMAVGFAT